MPAIPDSNPVLEAIKANEVKVLSSASDIASTAAGQSDLLRILAESADSAASAARTSVETAGAGLLAAQDSFTKSKQLLGSDPTDANSLVPVMAEMFRTNLEKSTVMAREIAAKNAVGLLDDPLEFLSWNLFEKSKAIGAYNAVASEGNKALAVIKEVNNATTEAANAAKAVAVTKTQASVAADAEVASFVYKAQAADANYKALSADIKGIEAIQQGNETVLAGRIKQWDIKSREFSQRQEAEGQALRRESLDMDRQKLEVYLDEHKDKAQAKETFRAIIGVGSGVFGFAMPSEAKMQQLEVLYQTPEGKIELQQIINAGIKKLTTGENILAPTPGHAVYVAAKLNPQLDKSNPAIAKRLDYVKSVASGLSIQEKGNGKAETIIESVNKRVENSVATWTGDAEVDGSLFKAPSLLEMSQVQPVVKTAFYQKILAAQVVAGIQNLSPDTMMQQGVAAMKEGKLSLDELNVGISTYYRYAALTNSMNNHSIGIPAQKTYNAKITGAGFFGADTVDLVRPEQINAAVMKLFVPNESKIISEMNSDPVNRIPYKAPPVGVQK